MFVSPKVLDATPQIRSNQRMLIRAFQQHLRQNLRLRVRRKIPIHMEATFKRTSFEELNLVLSKYLHVEYPMTIWCPDLKYSDSGT
jgi:hypothetical protein